MKIFVGFLLLFFCTGACSKPSYNRKDWGRWSDNDKNCLNTRAEILKKRSLIEVQMQGCRVISGKWKDFYFDEILTQAKKIDIDHVVPLAHAFKTGASTWTKKQKRAFYNDEENLVITNLKYNRQKKSKDFTQWHPAKREYACLYASKWFKIKKKYKLTFSSQELEFKALLKCENL